jgi:hypothetical protein
MALSLVVEAIAALRKVQAPQLPGLRLPQAGARNLIGLAALLFIAAPIAAQATTISSAAAAPATVGHVTAGADHAVQQAPARQDVKAETTQERQGPKTVDHVVKPGRAFGRSPKTTSVTEPATRRSPSSTATCSAPSRASSSPDG